MGKGDCVLPLFFSKGLKVVSASLAKDFTQYTAMHTPGILEKVVRQS